MKNNIEELIQTFLNEFCTKVGDFETPETVELYMDNHDCIEYGGQEYYVPNENSLWNEQDELLKTMILNTF